MPPLCFAPNSTMILVSVVSVEQKNDGMIENKTYPVLGCPPQDRQTNNLLFASSAVLGKIVRRIIRLPFCEFARRLSLYTETNTETTILVSVVIRAEK